MAVHHSVLSHLSVVHHELAMAASLGDGRVPCFAGVIKANAPITVWGSEVHVAVLSANDAEIAPFAAAASRELAVFNGKVAVAAVQELEMASSSFDSKRCVLSSAAVAVDFAVWHHCNILARLFAPKPNSLAFSEKKELELAMRTTFDHFRVTDAAVAVKANAPITVRGPKVDSTVDRGNNVEVAPFATAAF